MQARQATPGQQGLGHMPRWGHHQAWRPNKRVELTPLRGPKLAAFLKEGSSSTAFPIYKGGATHAQAVGPPIMPLAYVYLCKTDYLSVCLLDSADAR
jgi:hypothetical protein